MDGIDAGSFYSFPFILFYFRRLNSYRDAHTKWVLHKNVDGQIADCQNVDCQIADHQNVSF
jgi:hypothetical protein